MSQQAEKKKILIIRNSALGDVAMTVPVTYSFARQYPQMEIYYLTSPLCSKLFVDRPDNLHMLLTDYRGKHHGVKGLRSLIRELKTYNFDYVADFHDLIRSWIISAALRLAGSKVARLHKSRKERLELLRNQKPQENYIDRYCDVLSRLGFPVTLEFGTVFGKSVPPPPADVAQPAVGIAPFARYKTKTYPADKMKEVARALVAKGYTVYLFGGGGDEPRTLDKWCEEIPGCVNCAGKYALPDELKLMGQMRLMLTMDSANQHLASLVGTRVVTIWGSTVPYGGFLAYRQTMDDAICRYIDCQPCSTCGTNYCAKQTCECLTQLEPATVVDKLLSILENN